MVLIINRAGRYYVAGVAVAIGFKMSLFNIGSNGQYRLAALFAGWAGAQVSLPPPIHMAFVILVAITVGGTWALIAAVLNVTRNVNVVIATIMLNYIATGLVALLRRNSSPTRNPQVGRGDGVMPVRPASRPSTGCSRRSDSTCPAGAAPGLPIVRDPRRHRLLRAAVPKPLRVRPAATGLNPMAARSSGISPKRMVLTTIILSGAVAGLIGMAPCSPTRSTTSTAIRSP